jgi:type II secretion system protein G
MRRLLKKQSGFTLLELLIVIIIIGILALIIVPGLASGPKRARDAQRKADLRGVRNALETYYNDNNAYPAGDYSGLSTYLVNTYIQTLPQDPKNSGTYVYSYTPSPSGCAAGACSSYVMTSHLENTKDSQIKSGTTDTYEVTSQN